VQLYKNATASLASFVAALSGLQAKIPAANYTQLTGDASLVQSVLAAQGAKDVLVNDVMQIQQDVDAAGFAATDAIALQADLTVTLAQVNGMFSY